MGVRAAAGRGRGPGSGREGGAGTQASGQREPQNGRRGGGRAAAPPSVTGADGEGEGPNLEGTFAGRKEGKGCAGGQGWAERVLREPGSLRARDGDAQ